VRYNAAGVGEQIFVNGQEVARVTGLTSLVPRIEFSLVGHRAVIEVRSRWLVTIKAFRLSLNGSVLYSEGVAFSGPPFDAEFTDQVATTWHS
jgi:hypothetical protein